jgi:hypothetical protein
MIVVIDPLPPLSPSILSSHSLSLPMLRFITSSNGRRLIPCITTLLPKTEGRGQESAYRFFNATDNSSFKVTIPKVPPKKERYCRCHFVGHTQYPCTCGRNVRVVGNACKVCLKLVRIRESENGADDRFENKPRKASRKRYEGDPDAILDKMISNAKERTIKRGHVWNELKLLDNILTCSERQEVTDEATSITRLACPCGGDACNSTTISSNGNSKVSMDLVGVDGKGSEGGYCGSADGVRLLRQKCNTRTTRADEPVERKKQGKHRMRITNSMSESTISRFKGSVSTAIFPNSQARPRSDESLAEVKSMIGEGPDFDKKKLLDYNRKSYDIARAKSFELGSERAKDDCNTKITFKTAFEFIATKLRTFIYDSNDEPTLMQEDDPVCHYCYSKITFGNEDGMLVLKNDHTQASPERLDSSNILYSPENLVFICQACQSADREYPEGMVDLLLEGDRLEKFKAAVNRRIKLLEIKIAQSLN